MTTPDFGLNLVDLFEKSAAAGGDKPFLWGKVDGSYRPWSWTDVRDQVQRLSQALRAKGLKPGDRVLLVSENRPEWPIADLAVLRAGGVTVPAYTTNTEDDHLHLLSDCGASMVVVSNDKIAKNVLPAIKRSYGVGLLITIDDLKKTDDLGIDVLTWAEALTLGASEPESSDDPAATLSRDGLACLIYTSGTGGKPKGVMLSHGNVQANVESAYHVLRELGLGDDVFLSFLPLSHAYEHTAGLFLPIAIRAQIYYAEGIETLSTNLAEAKPTIMACVPRLYEVMRQRILNNIGQADRVEAQAVCQGGLDRQQGLRGSEVARSSRASAEPVAGPSGEKNRPRAVRRQDEGAGVGRSTAQLRGRVVFHGARLTGLSGLRANRVLACDQRQQTRSGQAENCRAGVAGHRG